MRFFKLSIAAVCLMLCLSVPHTFAADVAKIGLIDLQTILTTSEAGKAAHQKFAEMGQKLQSDLQAKGTALEEEQARYEREASVMSQEARSEKERELKIKALDLQDLKTKSESELQTLNQELVNQLQVEIFSVVSEIGKKEGYLLILDKSASGTVYAPTTIDLTDQVIEQYNKVYAAKTDG